MASAGGGAKKSEVALIVGGGPGISASCARLFRREGMTVAVAARTPDKTVLKELENEIGISRYQCDASQPDSVANLFESVGKDHGHPRLVVHNIDGRVPEIFGKGVTEADPNIVVQTVANGALSAFLVAQKAAMGMLESEPNEEGALGTIIFTNASAGMKGYPRSGAFAMTCHAKTGLAQSLARELMPQGIHIAQVPIDAAIGWRQKDGSRAHRRVGADVDDSLADPDQIAETYLHLHRQHRSTWAFEIALRPWKEKW